MAIIDKELEKINQEIINEMHDDLLNAFADTVVSLVLDLNEKISKGTESIQFTNAFATSNRVSENLIDSSYESYPEREAIISGNGYSGLLTVNEAIEKFNYETEIAIALEKNQEKTRGMKNGISIGTIKTIHLSNNVPYIEKIIPQYNNPIKNPEYKNTYQSLYEQLSGSSDLGSIMDKNMSNNMKNKKI